MFGELEEGVEDGLPGICDVLLPDISMEPVREVEILVVHADDDVGHDPRHLWQDPALHLVIVSCTTLFYDQVCPVLPPC